MKIKRVSEGRHSLSFRPTIIDAFTPVSDEYDVSFIDQSEFSIMIDISFIIRGISEAMNSNEGSQDIDLSIKEFSELSKILILCKESIERSNLDLDFSWNVTFPNRHGDKESVLISLFISLK